METIEEKAKRYDEAIKQLRIMMPNWENLSYNGKTFLQDLVHIIPELKESEDEKIRKALMQNLKERFGTKGNMGEGLDMPDVLAWPEKQGKKDEEILILKDQIESLHAAIKAIKETHKIELEKQGEQKSAKWSEEDETVLNNLIYALANDRIENDRDEYVNWLKSLRPQNKCTYNPYKEVVKSIADMCNHYGSFGDASANDFINNIRVKCKDAKEYDKLFPQTTWKPSDEQMKALKEACDEHWEPDGLDPLYTLYQDLNKLKA